MGNEVYKDEDINDLTDYLWEGDKMIGENKKDW